MATLEEVADEINNTDFTGHIRATGRSLWLAFADTMVFVRNSERYLWIGSRGITVGLDGSHTTTEFDLLQIGQVDVAHTDLIDITGPPENPHGMMRWRGEHANVGQYLQHDVVTDDGYLMIANKDTEDKPAPYPTGDPYDVRSLPGTPPAWTNESATTNALIVGQRFTFPDAGFVRQAQFYIPAGNVGAKAEMWAVTDPLTAPNYQILVPEFTIEDDDDDAWIVIPVGATLVRPNQTFDVVLILRSQTGETSWGAGWDAKRKNGAPSDGEAWHHSGGQDSLARISHEDDDGNDEQTRLEALNPGDEYEVAGTRYNILDIDRNANDVGLYPQPQSRPQENTYTYTFYTFAALPIPYVRVPNWYQFNAGVNGFVSTDGYDPDTLVLTDDLMGVDIQVQQGYFSDDWDIMSMPS